MNKNPKEFDNKIKVIDNFSGPKNKVYKVKLNSNYQNKFTIMKIYQNTSSGSIEYENLVDR